MGLNQGSNLEAGDKTGEESLPCLLWSPWPAAKTVLGLILPGRVTSLGCFSPPVIPILKLMYGHSYCGKHVSKEGVVGMTSQTSKSDAKSCLYTRYPEKNC